ncbi:MAG: right-handed parallel beta-helix repeat-containing protein [Candidatus Pacearchaeota archaeon]
MAKEEKTRKKTSEPSYVSWRASFFLVLILMCAIMLTDKVYASESCPDNIKIQADGSISMEQRYDPNDYFNVSGNIYNLKRSLSGCRYSGIRILRRGITLNCNGYSIYGDAAGNDRGIWIINANAVTITNCYIGMFWAGIEVEDSNTVVIIKNTIDGYDYDPHEYGVYLKNSKYSQILSNTIKDWKTSIRLENSNNTSISYNSINVKNSLIGRVREGIFIWGGSSYNTIEFNNIYTASNNTWGIQVGGASGSPTIQNNITHNTIENLSTGIYIGIKANNTKITNNRICSKVFDIRNVSNTHITCEYNMFNGSKISEGLCLSNTNIRECKTCSGCVRSDTNKCSIYCPGRGSNFPSGLPESPNSWCNLMPLVPQYGGINCNEQSPTGRCLGCGGNATNATGGEDTCSSCADCTTKLSNPNYQVIKLNYDITNVVGDCINLQNINGQGRIFDCQGHSIAGPGSNIAEAIYIKNSQNFTFVNCNLSNFKYGIEIDDSSHISISNTNISSMEKGIYAHGTSRSLNISQNKIFNNEDRGIYIDPTYSITNAMIIIKNNDITNSSGSRNKGALYLSGVRGTTSDNLVELNRICDNKLDLKISSSNLSLINNKYDRIDTSGTNQIVSSGNEPCLCNLTSATLTPNCPPEGCNLGDNITLEAELSGCDNGTLVINVYGEAYGKTCSMNLSVPCSVSGNSCSKDYTIGYVPQNCTGMQVGPTRAWIYSNTNLINETTNVNGNFIFGDIPLLKRIFVLPKYVAIPRDNEDCDKAYLYTTAVYEGGFNLDISTHAFTNYSTNSSQIAYPYLNDPTRPKNMFDSGFSLQSGHSNITAKFPVDSWNSNWLVFQNNSSAKIFSPPPNLHIVCLDTSINNSQCGYDGCNIGENITIKIKFSNNKNTVNNYINNISIWAMSDETCPFYTLSTRITPSTECIDVGLYSICEKNLTISSIPAGCEGKTMLVYETLVYNNSGNIIDARFGTPPDFFGNFSFYQELPGADMIEIVPWPNWEIQQGEFVEYQAWAINLTSHATYNLTSEPYYSNTLFNSSNTTVANNPGEPRYKFRGINFGEAEITIKYPKQAFPGVTPVSNTTTLSVYPNTGCKIFDAKITPYCTDNGKCQDGDQITLNVTVNATCLNLGMNKIIMNFSEHLNEASPSERCRFGLVAEDLELNECDWSAPSGTKVCARNVSLSNLPAPCAGKTVYAYGVTVKNSSGFLASLTRTVFPGFGNFTFSGLIGRLWVKITSPEDGSIFAYSNPPEIQFNLTSGPHGRISNWSWYIKKEEETNWYKFYNTTEESQANTTANLRDYIQETNRGPGSYKIKAEVRNQTSMADDTINIYFCKPGVPCAIISEPHEDEIIKKGVTASGSMRVFFNGSRSFDSNANPPDNFNLTWFFDITNRTKKVTGLYNRTNITPHLYEKSYIERSAITAELNASDGQNSTIDLVNFSFGYCQEQGQKVFPGQCLNQKYCNGSNCNGRICTLNPDCRAYDCCPGPPYCDYLTGQCIVTQSALGCGSRTSRNTCQNSSTTFPTRGCFWNATQASGNYCKNCTPAPPGPLMCRDYNNQWACDNDIYGCNVGATGPDARTILGKRENTSGVEYEAIATRCSWSTASNNCTLNVTWSPVIGGGGGGGPGDYSCNYYPSISDCGPPEGCTTNTGRKGRWINLTALSNGNCLNYSTCQACGIGFERLPFFEAWHMLVAACLIAMLYFLIQKNNIKIKNLREKNE